MEKKTYTHITRKSQKQSVWEARYGASKSANHGWARPWHWLKMRPKASFISFFPSVTNWGRELAEDTDIIPHVGPAELIMNGSVLQTRRLEEALETTWQFNNKQNRINKAEEPTETWPLWLCPWKMTLQCQFQVAKVRSKTPQVLGILPVFLFYKGLGVLLHSYAYP